MRWVRPGETGASREPPAPFPELGAAFEELLARIGRATERLDPTTAGVLLQTLLGMQDRFGRSVDGVARRAHDHLNWEAIGRIAGVTKQAAHHRWGRGDSSHGIAG